MQVMIEEKHDVHVITLTERVDAFTVPQLRLQVEALDTHPVQHYVIDLSQVDFLDSAGLALLVKLLKQARSRGGDVALIWSQCSDANRILSLTKFDKVFSIHDDLDAALQAIKEGS